MWLLAGTSDTSHVICTLDNHFLFQGGQCFGTAGYGGQMGFGDAENKLGWGYLTNYIDPTSVADDPRYLPLIHAVYETLKLL